MKAKTGLHREDQKHTVEKIKITGQLRACLLISFVALVLGIAGIAYVLTLEQPEGVETKKTILVIITLALCVYFSVSFTKEYLDNRTQRKQIAEMAARLTEQELPSPNQKSRAAETDALIRKIVQAISE